MTSERRQFEFTELVLLSLQGEIDQAQIAELDRILKSEPEKVADYVELLEIYSELSLAGSIGISSKVNSSVNEIELNYLAMVEKNAPPVDLPEQEPENVIVEIEESSKQLKKTNRFFRIYNTVISIAAVILVFFVIYANVFPPQFSIPVAKVTDQYNVVWHSGSDKLDNNENVLTNQPPYIIEKGIIKLVYNEGVDVLIEGPASFKIEKKGISLDYGRLYSSVSKTGQGFAVDTPNSRFIDLGTEFGVLVEKSKSSELHVLKGKVQYYSGLPGVDKVSQTIFENDARRFDAKSGKVQVIPVAEESFVRQLDSDTGMIWRGQKLNLADIIGGGNGLGAGLRIVGIDPATGKVSSEPLMQSRTQQRSQYSQVPDNPAVDGVFVPLGGENSQVVNSAGEVYNGFPETDGRYWMDITNKPVTGFENDTESISYARLNDIEYGTEIHPGIMMHANTGITFDLDAIRSKISGVKINKFTAFYGLSETLEGASIQKDAAADMFVLIDGMLKMTTHVDFDSMSNAYIEIDIDANDRFLTLVSCSDWNDADWTIFGDPALELEESN